MAVTENQEYLAALLHGRRSRMAEGAGLQMLCRNKTVAELGRRVLGGAEVGSATELELALVQGLAREVGDLAPQLPGAVSELLHWLVGRFQLEDLKVLVRRLVTKAPSERLRAHLISLPADLRLDVDALTKADSMEAFVRLMPSGALRRCLAKALDFYREQPRAFFLESALDQGYLAGLLAKVEALAGDEGDWVRPVIVQELDIFHLMLVTRGRLTYGLEPKILWPFHIGGTRISRSLFESLLAEADVAAIGARLTGSVVDSWVGRQGRPQEPAEVADAGLLERLAWSRFWRLANRAFRRSHMGSATAAAYVALRRVEVANLITICEGIRTGVPAEKIYARLIPLSSSEATHV